MIRLPTRVAVIVLLLLIALSPGAATGRTPATPLGARLAGSPAAWLDVEDLVGTWHSATHHHTTIMIVMKDTIAHQLTMRERYTDWEATYTPVITPALLLGRVSSAETLVFSRTPTAAQMAQEGEITPTVSRGGSTTPPYWARQMVAGTLTWRLELHIEVGKRVGEYALVGAFYPGLISWRATTDPATGVVLSREAWVSGKGPGREVTYTTVDDGG